MGEGKSSRVRTRRLKNGRNRVARFVMLPHYLLKSPAYLDLDVRAKVALTFLKMFYNGSNNGNVYASCRDLAKFAHCSKDNALRALRELVANGFIKPSQPGSFHWKNGEASTWILTDEPLNNALPTKDFTRWDPSTSLRMKRKKQKPGPQSGTARSLSED